MTLAGPLPPNSFYFTNTPLAFTFSDGVHTITNLTSYFSFFAFNTGPTGQITEWLVSVFGPGHILTDNAVGF